MRLAESPPATGSSYLDEQYDIDIYGLAPDKMTYTEQANKRAHCRRLTWCALPCPLLPFLTTSPAPGLHCNVHARLLQSPSQLTSHQDECATYLSNVEHRSHCSSSLYIKVCTQSMLCYKCHTIQYIQ